MLYYVYRKGGVIMATSSFTSSVMVTKQSAKSLDSAINKIITSSNINSTKKIKTVEKGDLKKIFATK